MLTGVATQGDGRQLVLIGISEGNWQMLRPGRDRPLHVKGAELGLPVDVIVWSGKDERTMAAQMREWTDAAIREADPPPPPTAPEPVNAGVDHGAVPEAAMRAAIEAAHAELVKAGVQDPGVVLIAQEDATQARGLASTIANPADLLRVVLWNLEQRAGG